MKPAGSPWHHASVEIADRIALLGHGIAWNPYLRLMIIAIMAPPPAREPGLGRTRPQLPCQTGVSCPMRPDQIRQAWPGPRRRRRHARALPGRPAVCAMTNHSEGLLRHPRRLPRGGPRRHQESLPQARQAIPPGRQRRPATPPNGSGNSPKPTTRSPTPSGAAATTGSTAHIPGAGTRRFRQSGKNTSSGNGAKPGNGSADNDSQAASRILKVLEDIWLEIRRRHPEIPPVVIIIASGTDGKQARWGHHAPGRWHVAGETRTEIMISGEGLRRPPRDVLGTLLHEAAHALAAARGIQDTSRQGRYHNIRFAQLARELGIDVTQTPRHWAGASPPSPTTPPAPTPAQLQALQDAMTLWRQSETITRPAQRRSNGFIAATCPCGRTIRVAASTLAAAQDHLRSLRQLIRAQSLLTLKRQSRRTQALLPIACTVLAATRLSHPGKRHGAGLPSQAPAPAYPPTPEREDVDCHEPYQPPCHQPPQRPPAPAVDEPGDTPRRAWFIEFYDPDGTRYGLPTYPYRWAPQGLLTIRQLRARGLRPGGQDIAAQILWRRGKRVAYLYRERPRQAQAAAPPPPSSPPSAGPCAPAAPARPAAPRSPTTSPAHTANATTAPAGGTR